MKKRLIAFVVMALFVVMACGQEPRQPTAAQIRTGEGRGRFGPSSDAPWRQRWEYVVHRNGEIQELGDGDLQAGLNNLGGEGWELVAVQASGPEPAKGGRKQDSSALPRRTSATASSTRSMFYFKRATSPVPMGMFGGMGGFGGPGGAAGGFGGAAGGVGFGTGGFNRPEARPERGPAGEPQRPPQPPQRPGAGTGGPSRPEGAAAAKPIFHVIALKHANAQELANEFGQLFDQPSMRVIADGRSNSLIVSGTEDQVRAIRELVAALDGTAPVKSN